LVFPLRSIPLSPFLNSVNLCSYCWVRDQVWHPYKTTHKITELNDCNWLSSETLVQD
jgi:hypothetical protein